MTRPYPDEAVGGFPAPPREITDREGRQITLDEVGRDDAEELVSMYLAFDPEDRAQGIPPATEPAIREWLEAVVTDDALNVLARHEGQPVGHVMLVPDREGASELAIFVLQSHQGASIGTVLVRTVLGLAERESLERVWLTVERWNTPAMALYEKIGFERTGDGSFELEMSLRLDPDVN